VKVWLENVIRAESRGVVSVFVAEYVINEQSGIDYVQLENVTTRGALKMVYV
jgi:hypothetical protein